jgi:hypothetical protein
MPLGNSSVEVRLSALMTRLIGESNLEARTELGNVGNLRFTEGAGALQATAVVDTPVACNNVAAAFSGFSRIDGNAFGALTKLKLAIFYNPPTNAAVVLTSSVSGVSIGTVQPGGFILWLSPTAGGLTVSGASTFTANGGGALQNLRVIMFLA